MQAVQAIAPYWREVFALGLLLGVVLMWVERRGKR